MTKKKLALVIVAVIAVIGIILGVMVVTLNRDKTTENGNETSSTTSVSDTASKEDTTSTDTTSTEDTTTTDTSSDATSTTSKDNTTSKAEPSTSSTTNPEQGKEGDRPMAEVMEDIVVLSDGKKLKVIDLITLKDEDLVLTPEGGMLPESYRNWANRLGIPDEDLITYPTEKYGTVVDCGGTMESILKKNGYKDVYEISTYK